MNHPSPTSLLVRYLERLDRLRSIPNTESTEPLPRWCFPTDLSTISHSAVDDYFAQSSHNAGDVLLAAYVPLQDSGQLYRLHYEGRSPRLQVHDKTLTAWLNARAAVPRSLPYFLPHPDWRRMHTFPNMQPTGNRYYADARRHKEAHSMKRPVDGTSFGLAFALSIASRLLDEPLPDDLVGLARCDPQGKLGSVDGLDAKLKAIRLDAPRIRRVIISKEQDLPSDLVLQDSFTFLQRDTLQDTLTLDVYDSAKMRSILEKHIHTASLSEQVDAALDFVLFEPPPNTYRPYIKTCELLAERLESERSNRTRNAYNDLDAKLRYCIARTRNRGGGDGDDCFIPAPQTWVPNQPRWLRRRLMAGYAQYTYGHAAFDPQEMLDLLESDDLNLALDLDVEQTSSDELALLGARTRLLEHVGRHQEALDIHTRIAAQWCRRRRFDQATWSLSRAIVLAGLLEDKERLERLQTLTQTVLLYLPAPNDGRTFLHLAWYRTEVFREHTRSQSTGLNTGQPKSTHDEGQQSLSIQWLQAELDAKRLHEHVPHGFDRFALLAGAADSAARAHHLREAKDPIYPLLYEITAAYLQGDEHAMQHAREKFRDRDIVARRLEASLPRSDAFTRFNASSITEQTRIVLFLYPY